MKNLKIVLIWMVLAIGLQSLVLFILDRTYFSTNSDVDVQKVEIKEDTTENDANIPIPENAKNIYFSYNGEYVCYFENQEMKIINTTNGEEKSIDTNNKIQYEVFQWLPDRNRILAIGKDVSTKTNKLISVDVDANAIKEVDISSINSKNKFDQISPSTKTGIIYIRASQNGITSVYRLDNNDEVTKVNLNTNKINAINIVTTQDRLVYETAKNNFYITQPDKRILTDEDGTYSLLGIDDNNVLYVNKLNNEGKVIGVSYKNINSDSNIDNEKWTKINLSEPVSTENVFLDSYNSKTIVNDTVNKKVINLNTEKEYSYTGNLIDIYNNGFATLENGKVNKYKFKS
ncbi:MAG: hypothetical protein ACRC7N_12935 [Clostridium sp.]